MIEMGGWQGLDRVLPCRARIQVPDLELFTQYGPGSQQFGGHSPKPMGRIWGFLRTDPIPIQPPALQHHQTDNSKQQPPEKNGGSEVLDH